VAKCWSNHSSTETSIYATPRNVARRPFRIKMIVAPELGRLVRIRTNCFDLKIDDAVDIAVRALLTRMQAVDVPLGQRHEDNPHKVSLLLGRGEARLDAPRIAAAWNARRRIAQVFLMPRHDFFTKPALHRRVAPQQGAHDLADGGMGPDLICSPRPRPCRAAE
jgi:hypothetical protein